MVVDLSPILNGDVKVIEFARSYTPKDLRKLSDESIDTILEIIRDLDDADVVFDPVDPDAYDPYAPEDEQRIGWSIAHLIAHVTASSEEGAAFSSLLARGIPAKERPRYETPWRAITTKAQCVQRLEESRRMRNAYLATWPDQPFLDVYREASEKFIEHFGQMNAPAAFIFGIAHEYGHHEQMRDVARQAHEAKQSRAVSS